jgi:hypothetical protein
VTNTNEDWESQEVENGIWDDRERENKEKQSCTEAHSAKTAFPNVLHVLKHNKVYSEYFSTSVPVTTVPSRFSEVLTFSLVFSNLVKDVDVWSSNTRNRWRVQHLRLFQCHNSGESPQRSCGKVILIDSHKDWMLMSLWCVNATDKIRIRGQDSRGQNGLLSRGVPEGVYELEVWGLEETIVF